VKKMLEERLILSFLHFGYLPQIPRNLSSEPWVGNKSDACDTIRKSPNKPQLIAQGIHALKAAFQNIVGGMHIVPLSGGLDSRAILGGLLNAGLKNRIAMVTFGTPGTLDYEIGSYVAKRIGLRHEAIDLTRVKLDQEVLEKTIDEGGAWTYLIDSFYNRLISKRFGKDPTYWSGFMGDPLAGSHLLPTDSNSWREALDKFVKRNSFSRSIVLTPPGFRPEDVLPQSPLLNESHLSYDEQLDFGIRQQCCIKPLVLPEGYDYRAPFLQPDWVNFILSVPRRYREYQFLYKEILKEAYPKLFSLPTKTNFGLPLDAPKWQLQLQQLTLRVRSAARRFFPSGSWGAHPMTNYIDFDQGLRARKDLKNVVYENIQDLKRHGIIEWLDINEIWNRHQRKQANYADVLILLASLEINLKVQEKSA